MALTVSSIKAIIKAEREAVLGPPDDPVIADKNYTADANWVFKILTVEATTVLNNGADSNGDTLTDLTGKIV